MRNKRGDASGNNDVSVVRLLFIFGLYPLPNIPIFGLWLRPNRPPKKCRTSETLTHTR